MPTKKQLEKALLHVQGSPKHRFLLIHLDVPVSSSWELISVKQQPQVIWRDGSNDQILIGYGKAWTHTIESNSAFADAKIVSQKLFAQIYQMGDTTLGPILFAGFSFQPNGESLRNDWQNWPRNQLILPRVFIEHNASSPQATFSFFFDTNISTSAEDILQEMSQSLQQKELQGTNQTSLVKNNNPIHLTMQVLERKENWEQKIEDIKEQIQRGNLHKVVTARAALFAAEKEHGFSTRLSFLQLCLQNPNCYSFAFGPHQDQSFIGASPETLVRYVDGEVQTQALAGTIPRSTNPQIDKQRKNQLLQSTKNRTEQGYVVNAIYESLRTVCTDVQVEREPHILALPRLFHLNTSISGYAEKQTHILDLVSLLHPTPALGGWPSQQAQQWLAKHETLERGWYDGPIGWFDGEGNGVFCVAIRSALIGDNTALAYGGAGIVEASNADSEWLETELKFKTITEALHGKEEQK